MRGLSSSGRRDQRRADTGAHPGHGAAAVPGAWVRTDDDGGDRRGRPDRDLDAVPVLPEQGGAGHRAAGHPRAPGRRVPQSPTGRAAGGGARPRPLRLPGRSPCRPCAEPPDPRHRRQLPRPAGLGWSRTSSTSAPCWSRPSPIGSDDQKATSSAWRRPAWRLWCSTSPGPSWPGSGASRRSSLRWSPDRGRLEQRQQRSCSTGAPASRSLSPLARQQLPGPPPAGEAVSEAQAGSISTPSRGATSCATAGRSRQPREGQPAPRR